MEILEKMKALEGDRLELQQSMCEICSAIIGNAKKHYQWHNYANAFVGWRARVDMPLTLNGVEFDGYTAEETELPRTKK